MIKTIEEELAGKWVLHRVTSYDGWGNYKSEPTRIGSEDELIQYCDENSLDYKSPYPEYIIKAPVKEETIKEDKDKDKDDICNIPSNTTMDFEPPVFMKAAMRIKDVVIFKDLADKLLNSQHINTLKDNTTITIEGKEITKYMNAWISGLCDPRSGIANYMGLVQSQLYYTLLNHVAYLYVNNKTFYLLPRASNNEGLMTFHVIDPEKDGVI